MFNCPHTGVALAALEKLVARGEIKRTDRVIVISTANGLKFTEFKIAYHTQHAGGRACPLRQPAGRTAERLRRGAARDRSRCRAADGGDVRCSVGAERRRGAPRSLEVRRRVAGRRARRSEGRGPDRRHTGPARRRRVGAGRRHRSAARGRRSRDGRTEQRRGRCAAGVPAPPPRGRARAAAGGASAASDCSQPIDAAAREYRELCGAVGVLGHLAPRASDMLVSRGERLSAHDARRRARRAAGRRGAVRRRRPTSSPPTASTAAPRRTFPRRPRRARRVAASAARAPARSPVVPGFIGRAPDGSVTTLGRGGSDLTATLLGRALGAQARRAVEGRARHPDGRPAARAGRAADPAAASSRSGRGRALRREGAASARADPDRRHAHRRCTSARSSTRRSRAPRCRRGARSRPIRSRRWRSSAARRSSPSPARAWSASTASPRARSPPSTPSGCRSRRSSRRRPRARSASRCPKPKPSAPSTSICARRSATSWRAA